MTIANDNDPVAFVRESNVPPPPVDWVANVEKTNRTAEELIREGRGWLAEAFMSPDGTMPENFAERFELIWDYIVTLSRRDRNTGGTYKSGLFTAHTKARDAVLDYARNHESV